MMHFMGFDLSLEKKYATYGQMLERENGNCALFVQLLGLVFRRWLLLVTPNMPSFYFY